MNFNVSSLGLFALDVLADAWRYKIADAKWSWMAGNENLDASPTFGQLLVPDSQVSPGGRSAASSCYDSTTKEAWIFGGAGFITSTSESYWNNLWRFRFVIPQVPVAPPSKAPLFLSAPFDGFYSSSSAISQTAVIAAGVGGGVAFIILIVAIVLISRCVIRSRRDRARTTVYSSSYRSNEAEMQQTQSTPVVLTQHQPQPQPVITPAPLVDSPPSVQPFIVVDSEPMRFERLVSAPAGGMRLTDGGPSQNTAHGGSTLPVFSPIESLHPAATLPYSIDLTKH